MRRENQEKERVMKIDPDKLKDVFMRVEIIANGNCMLCGKSLSGNRLFLCEECEKKEHQKGENSEEP